jgi:hypothetical protein
MAKLPSQMEKLLSKIGNGTSLSSPRLPPIPAITNPHKIAWMKPLG